MKGGNNCMQNQGDCEKNVENQECKSQVEIDLFHTVKTPMTKSMTVIGLVNGMIGGTCLVLPHIGLRTGWAMSILVALVTGWISYYTAYLIVLHLGKGTQIKDCILNHFNNDYRYMTGYSFFIWFSFMPGLLIYFRIICLQIEGLMGHHSDYTASLVAVGLVIIIILVRIYHIGEETLAYGVISIIGYVLFLIWAQFTTPEGPKTVQAFDQPVTLTSTLILAYSIHDFLVANIVKNPNRNQYHSTVRWTFFTGTIVYTFIALGSFAIVNRVPFKTPPETINDFFRTGQWQSSLLNAVYMIHMISAFPNFLIISKVRFFQMFKIEIHHRIDWHEALYILIVVVMSYIVYITGIKLQVLIQLSGSVLGFTYIIVIPIWLHFKCVFFDRSSGYVQNDPQWNSQIVPNACECDNVYKNKFLLYLQTAFLVLVLIFGVVLMFFSIRNISKANSPSKV